MTNGKDIILKPSFGEFFHTVYIITGDKTEERTATFDKIPKLLSSYPDYTIHFFGNEDFLKRIEKELKQKGADKYNVDSWKIVYNK